MFQIIIIFEISQDDTICNKIGGGKFGVLINIAIHNASLIGESPKVNKSRPDRENLSIIWEIFFVIYRVLYFYCATLTLGFSVRIPDFYIS